MSTFNEINEGNKAVRKMLFFLLVALIPLLLVSVIYMNNTNSNFLNAISCGMENLPAISSSNSPLLTKVMDAYVKTAPFFAFFVFLVSCKNLKLKRGQSAWNMLMIYILFTTFYAILIYSFLFTNTELTDSKKILKVMSINDFTLSFFYASLYSGVYIFSYLYLWFAIGTYRAFKERW